MKYAANLLTVLRILLLPVLFFVYDDTAVFVGLYLLAGLTDVLDGFIARKTNTQSKLGARLDSVADLLLFAFILFVLFHRMGDEFASYLPWVGAVVAIRCVSLIISVFKYREVVFLHTWGNKLAGFLVFLCPVVLSFRPGAVFLWLIIVAAALSATEESVIHLTSRTPDLNRRSIFLS